MLAKRFNLKAFISRYHWKCLLLFLSFLPSGISVLSNLMDKFSKILKFFLIFLFISKVFNFEIFLTLPSQFLLILSLITSQSSYFPYIHLSQNNSCSMVIKSYISPGILNRVLYLNFPPIS